MKKIAVLSGAIVFAIGFLGLIFILDKQNLSEPISDYAIRIVLMVWGGGLILSGIYDYRGGGASIFGSMLIGSQMVYIARSVETGDYGKMGEGVEMFIAHIIIFTIGLALLRYGYMKNKKEQERTREL